MNARVKTGTDDAYETSERPKDAQQHDEQWVKVTIFEHFLHDPCLLGHGECWCDMGEDAHSGVWWPNGLKLSDGGWVGQVWNTETAERQPLFAGARG